MTFQFQSLLKAGDTLSQICGLGEDIVLAIITGVVEPPYRPVGAIMGGSFEWHPKKCFWRCYQTNEPEHQFIYHYADQLLCSRFLLQRDHLDI